MRKCYFITDPIRGTKVLIPECYGSLHHDDLSGCICADQPLTYNQFQKEKYNEVVNSLNDEVAELRQELATCRKENNALTRVIRNLLKRRNVKRNVRPHQPD